MTNLERHGIQKTVDLITSLYPDECIKPTESGVRKSITKCKTTQTRLKKYGSKGAHDLETFLNEQFQFPTARARGREPKQPAVTPRNPAPKSEDALLITAYKNTALNIGTELSQEKKNHLVTKQSSQNKDRNIRGLRFLNQVTARQLAKANWDLNRVRQQDKRNRQLQTENTKLVKAKDKQIKTLKVKCEQKNQTLKQLRSRDTYYSDKVNRLEIRCQELTELLEEKEAENTQLLQDLQNARNECRELVHRNTELEVWRDDRVINTKVPDGTRYADFTRLCIYKLLNCRVSITNIPEVIETVLDFAGITCPELPKRSTISEMNIERLSLSQQQIAEKVPECENMTLYTDETTKHGDKFGTYHLSDEDGMMYTMGMRLLPTKSAENTLNTYSDILDDLDLASHTGDQVSKAIIVHTKNTMSDQASTEKKFNELYHDLRKDAIPHVIENYDQLTVPQQEAILRMNNFYCALHPFIQMSESSESLLKEAEGDLIPDNIKSKYGSSTANLIRASAKAVARGADEKSGCHGTFLAFISPFLKENGLSSIPIAPPRGSKFNIMFSNAAGVFFLHDKIVEYLTRNHDNKLLDMVFLGLQNTFLVSGIKALGLICYQITAPFWRCIEAKQVNILDLNNICHNLYQFCREASDDASGFMEGTAVPFPAKIHQDAVYARLLSKDDYDNQVQTILQLLFPGLAEVTKRMYKEHLPGGNHDLPTPDKRIETSGVRTTNRFAESAFAYLDQLMQAKPAIKALASEAYLMFCLNKTGEWLDTKSPQDLKKLISVARKSVKNKKVLYKQRALEIQEFRRKQIKEKQAKAEELEKKRREEKDKLVKEIEEVGYWLNPQEMNDYLSQNQLSFTDQEKVLKNQLKFRKLLDQQSNRKDAFTLTVKGNVQHRVDVLKPKVQLLMEYK